ncbi:hypothetical protein M222_0706 [Enterococcus faecalis AZ19]|nr:hypothetical protein HMPREF9505_01854 [Enterococcus faecalis TX0109]EFU09462.1 hypothetical protein HMPREF9516_00905 [Enterococcus faecalis TX1302]EPH73116.1 hypothetical protein D928_00486 [Enterococcus faecalis 20-SD-BW-06]EPI01244.1 hypothetical protein D919_01567 [Enterococcus faecalis 20-SD-BW-08]KAJ76236.1 hypothetical protein M222_0706 [Enterococcus faecalis AZ19]
MTNRLEKKQKISQTNQLFFKFKVKNNKKASLVTQGGFFWLK